MVRRNTPRKFINKRKIREQVLHRDNYVCQYCGGKAEVADHIIPKIYGGVNAGHNMVACCVQCNQIVGENVFDSFKEKKVFILEQRQRQKHKHRLYVNTRCIDCNSLFNPLDRQATLFLCPQCNEATNT